MPSYKYNYESSSMLQQECVKKHTGALKNGEQTAMMNAVAPHSTAPFTVPKVPLSGNLDMEIPVNNTKAWDDDFATLASIGQSGALETSIGDKMKAMRQRMGQFDPNWKLGSESLFSDSENAFRMIPDKHSNSPDHTALHPKLNDFVQDIVPHIEKLNENTRKLKLNVDTGYAYKPEEVTIKIDGHHIFIGAIHEEMAPTAQKSIQEFTQTFACPERIETSTVQAFLGPNGQLIVGASLASNKDHHAVSESIKMDIPTGGRCVNIINN